MVSSGPSQPPRSLPALRADLRHFPAAAERDGAPAWMIEDPVTNRFFRIGWIEHELLRRWSIGDRGRLIGAVRRETPLAVSDAELDGFIAFLRDNQLLRASNPADTARLIAVNTRASGSRWTWLLHHYLFFRIPLFRPQHGLQRAAPWIAFCFSRGFNRFVILCTVVGLLLALRQWDVFVHTFQDHLSPAGLLGYAVALVFAKTLHELGHAFTATRYGVRVAHMGVAFLVMWPMLYTDTGESWKLSDRRQRFAIAAAGIRTELALAGFATLGWSLADDGPLRSALFFLATTSWLLTLAINASPFMRFDGYFLLSDALDLPNLHARAFALARAGLRRSVLGWDEPDPEPFSPTMRRSLVVFAWLTWIYRLVLYLGIAVAVYLFFFKLLGLFLLAVELAWFVVRPIAGELRVWAAGRRRAQAGYAARSLILLIAVLAVLAVPWRSGIHGEAWLHSARQQIVYSPLPARLIEIAPAGAIGAGSALVRLDSPEVRSRTALSVIAADALALQLDQTVGRAEGQERRGRIAEQLAQQRAESSAQRAELQRLSLVADFDGMLADIDPQLAPGVWVNPAQPIAVLYDPTQWVVDALIAQDAIARVKVGAPAVFHRRGAASRPLPGKVVAIDSARLQQLPNPMLAATHGGRLPTVSQGAGALAPRDAVYRVRIRLDAEPESRHTGLRQIGSRQTELRQTELRQTLGSVTIDGERRSLLADAWLRVAAVLVQESGF